jgi:hypothetical protein
MHDRSQKVHQSTTTKAPRRQFVLTLRQTPSCDDPIRSLRHILKYALRAQFMRCTSIGEIPDEASPPLAPSEGQHEKVRS